MLKYSFLDNNEPTDEQLVELMHEVAVEARERSIDAEKNSKSMFIIWF